MPAGIPPSGMKPPRDKTEHTPPNRREGNPGDNITQHKGFTPPPSIRSSTSQDPIKVTPEQLQTWAAQFRDMSDRLGNVGDKLYRLHAEPGYFKEADDVRRLVQEFQSTFVPNVRVLAQSAAWVGKCLDDVATTFNQVEKVNADSNTTLSDEMNALRGLTVSLKPLQGLSPNTPTGSTSSPTLTAPKT